LPADLTLMSLLADAMPGLVSYMDSGLRYRFLNRAYRDWFGVAPETYLGKTPLEIAGPEAFRRFEPHLRCGLAGERHVYEETIPFQHGGTRTIRGFLVPDRAPDGTVRGIFSFTADISEERATQDALSRAHQEAVVATRAKSEFLAAASHDLRQPLHAMALFISALGRRVKDPETVEIVEHLRTAVESMRHMFGALLDISKLDAGALTPAPEDFPVSDLFGQLRPGFAAQAAAKDIRFRLVPSSAVVRTDPALLETILRNLLHNAVKFTEHGSVLLGCRRRGNRLRIDVTDSGIGIPHEQIDAVFDEFRRLNMGRNTGSEGLGLGLAIVRRLAALLGLVIDVVSVPGHGSRFSVTVPLGRPAQAGHVPAAAPAVPDSASLAGAKVLAVDDDEMVRGAMTRLLADWGCTVAAAGTPSEALHRIDREGFQPDLLLIDYNLGNTLDGLDLIALLARRMPRVPPAIVVTGSTDSDAILRFEASGHAWLSKPVDAAQLRRTAIRLLEKARGGG